MDETAVVKRDRMSVVEVRENVNLIQQVMDAVMHKGEHYGVIPGCGDKPTLLKPGAEKLCTTFRLSPTYEIRKTDLDRGHREYEIVCTLTHIPTGDVFGQGVGSCSTMESKYRYRDAQRKCPECGAEAIIRGKKEYGGGWLCFKKKGGCGAKYQDGDPAIEEQAQGKVENPDPADQYNTVLKMAKKRAHVDAVLTVTAASDIFTQDLEDMAANGVAPASQQNGKRQDPFEAMVAAKGVGPGTRQMLDAYVQHLAKGKTRPEEVRMRAVNNPDAFWQRFADWMQAMDGQQQPVDEPPPDSVREEFEQDLEQMEL